MTEERQGEKWERISHSIKYGLLESGGILIAIIGTVLIWDKIFPNEYVNSNIPRGAIVQQGYVNPSKLEIKLENKDGIKGDELYLNYNKKSYLLKEDEQGKPYIQEYELKPTEIIEK